MKKAIDEAHRQYEAFEKNRSTCMDITGRLRAESKAAINFIVSGDVEKGKKTLKAAPGMVKELGGLLRRHPYLYSVPALNEGLEEYVEAVALLGYIEGKKSFPSPRSLGINHEAYIGGLCDMTGELVRLARSKPERAEAVARDVAGLYGRAVGMYVKRNSKIRTKLQDLERNLVRLEEIVSAVGRFPARRMADDTMGPYAKEKREDHRPWGFFQILSDAKDCKVKRITVFPGQRLSLQRHRRRSEHWHVFHGRGVVTLDDREINVEPGRSVDIPRGSLHRIKSAGDENLVLIEVQTGDYFGEDDIERVEDDYGRA